MLDRLDAALLDWTNRLAAWLQEANGLTMPNILRHAATATIVSTVLAVVATALFRSPVIAALMGVFGAMTVSALWRVLARYQRDAEKDWTSDLARDYAVRAIGAMEGQRMVRHVAVLLTLFMVILTVMASQFRTNDLVDILAIALLGATMAHLYLSCAEPRPPGMGRRQPRLATVGAP
jgi:hypothetical protein